MGEGIATGSRDIRGLREEGATKARTETRNGSAACTKAGERVSTRTGAEACTRTERIAVGGLAEGNSAKVTSIVRTATADAKSMMNSRRNVALK